jgi:histidinol phosphatase-like enzyme
MFEQAKHKYAIDLTRSLMIGDNESDLIASNTAGVKHNFLLRGQDQSVDPKRDFYRVIDSLAVAQQFVEYIA